MSEVSGLGDRLRDHPAPQALSAELGVKEHPPESAQAASLVREREAARQLTVAIDEPGASAPRPSALDRGRDGASDAIDEGWAHSVLGRIEALVEVHDRFGVAVSHISSQGRQCRFAHGHPIIVPP